MERHHAGGTVAAGDLLPSGQCYGRPLWCGEPADGPTEQSSQELTCVGMSRLGGAVVGIARCHGAGLKSEVTAGPSPGRADDAADGGGAAETLPPWLSHGDRWADRAVVSPLLGRGPRLAVNEWDDETIDEGPG